MINSIRNKIVQRAVKRGIEYLVHFTRKENLTSITTYGLRSRQELVQNRLNFKYNDDQRLDGFPNSISLSMTFPNYKMFYSCRKKNSGVWAVILLDACQVLENCECAFHSTNAANNTMRDEPLQNRKTLEAFESMFYDDNNLRSALALKDNEPTDPQAEILCFDVIPTKFFKGILFDGELFSYRHDWSYWQKIF